MKNVVVRVFRATAVVVLVAGLWVFYLAYATGEFRSLEPMGPEECQQIAGVPGAEDIVVHRGLELALLSSDDRVGGTGGAIYRFDLVAPDAEPIELEVDVEKPFHPLGLSLVADQDGGVLFVVNRTEKGSAVEIFDWEDPQASTQSTTQPGTQSSAESSAEGGTERGTGLVLVHRTTVSDPLLISVNDVAGVDDVRFYATNDHGSRSAAGRVFEDYLRLERSNVVYWDGTSARVVAKGIGFANGIALSLDQDQLYVASTTTGRVLVFDLDLRNGDLMPQRQIELGTGVDNLDVDRNGRIWAAAHPKLLTFARHTSRPARRSPSEVVFIDPFHELEPPVRPVYLSHGEELSGSSVAVAWGSKLIIGSVFEPHFLICQR